jgi:DNA-binding NtrC family response regulator
MKAAAPISILFSWLWHDYLLSYGLRLGGPELHGAEAMTGAKVNRSKHQRGPLASLLKHRSFDEVHVLCAEATPLVKKCASDLWIGAQIHPVKLTLTSRYDVVFRKMKEVMEKALAGRRDEVKVSVHLSSGTAAMAAAWVLLGKSLFPAEFFETTQGEVTRTEIPFDLETDYLPQVLGASDRLIQDSSQLDVAVEFGGITGKSPVIKAAVDRASRIAKRDVNVLLLGESGVGKEIFAHAIHKESQRKGKELVEVNCAALPLDLLDSELFGHTDGSYTGAKEDRDGRFMAAHESTLFLDEVGECDLQLQAKLLRVLQPPRDGKLTHRTFTPVGADKTVSADVRIIAATNRDLRAEIAAGRFREDLYYRLAGVTVHIPPLRARGQDVILIAETLLAQINDDFSRSGVPNYVEKKLTGAAKKFIRSYEWPGNIRQLRNVLTQAAALVDRAELGVEEIRDGLADLLDVRRAPLELEPGFRLHDHMLEVQRRYVERAMEQAGGNKSAAAKLLGYANYQRLDAQLKRLGVG